MTTLSQKDLLSVELRVLRGLQKIAEESGQANFATAVSRRLQDTQKQVSEIEEIERENHRRFLEQQVIDLEADIVRLKTSVEEAEHALRLVYMAQRDPPTSHVIGVIENWLILNSKALFDARTERNPHYGQKKA